MAVTNIHVTEKGIIDCIARNAMVDIDSATRHYYVKMEHALAFYAMRTRSICLYLQKTFMADKLFDGVNAQKKNFEERLCYILTHEEIHHWLCNNVGMMASTKFDNIAFKFMKEM